LSTLIGATCANAALAPRRTKTSARQTEWLRNAGLRDSFFRDNGRDDGQRGRQRADDVRVKFGARGSPELAQRLLRWAARPIGARVRHRVVRIRDVHD